MRTFNDTTGRPQTRDQHIANQANNDAVMCTDCKQTTDRETAVSFGSLCARCYGAYCREHQPPGPPPTIAQRKVIAQRLREAVGQARSPRAWARDLQQRERGGEVLTPLQRSMWRAALRHEGNAP